jgi:phenylacetate-CoA ligase
MRFFNLLINIIFHLLPPGMMDYLGNASLPTSDRSFKIFSKIKGSVFEYYSRKKVLYMFKKTSKDVPAYRKFLGQHNIDPISIKNIDDFNSLVPCTTKENYIRSYSLTERCINGKIPLKITLDESSGTSGEPTFWVRSEDEEKYTMMLMKASFKHLYGFRNEENFFVLNCFMQGGWTGGQRFASRIEPLASVKNVGPDPAKAIRVIRELGKGFTYLISGYPPFILDLIEYGKNLNQFNWQDYRIHIFAGGEGFVEEWRDYVSSQLKPGAQIFSDYGAIDLDAGISIETPFSVIIRKLLREDVSLQNAILSSDRLPCFLGQYSNQQYFIREIKNEQQRKELEITVMNLKSVSPSIKYIIGDEGGIMKFQDLCKILENRGYQVSKLKKDYNVPVIIPFPFVWLYGRRDGTVTINGAMISQNEISEALLSEPVLVEAINAFKMWVASDKDNYIRLFVYLETRKNIQINESLVRCGNKAILNKLLESNECFRVSYRKDPVRHGPVINIIPFGTGLFCQKEDSVKFRYTK